MGTGIESVVLRLADQRALSAILFALTAIACVMLALLFTLRVLHDREGVSAQARNPAGLTGVAATAVLGSRLVSAGLRWEALVLLIGALGLWLGLLLALVRRPRLSPTGSSFMLTVAPQSLAVLAAVIAASGHSRWLIWPALVASALGLALYPFSLARFDLRELVAGGGDQWVAGGALAISALASSEIGRAAARTGGLATATPAIHTISVAIWIACMAWLPILVASEMVRPRLRYDLRRWSTVFPVGMYAACSYAVARVSGVSAPSAFADVWTWVGVAVWLLIAAGMLAQMVRTGAPLLRRSFARTGESAGQSR
jgi:tellurite resistance protein TehA-like permease